MTREESKEFSNRLIAAIDLYAAASWKSRPNMTSRASLLYLIDFLQRENKETEGVGIGITWGLWQKQKGGYSAGISADGQTPYRDFDGDTAAEALGWAVLSYVEDKKEREKKNAAGE